MATRRTLNHALEVTADKLAFIRHGSGHATGGNVATDSGTEHHKLPDNQPKADVAGTDTLHRELSPTIGVAETRTEPQHPSLLGEVLVPLTTRIRPETANALRRAYLVQKLAHRTPATQQEIIEAALTTWLRQHEFL